jgi:hypothetical protein
MSAAAGNANAFPFKGTRQRQYLFQLEATLTTAGAVNVTTSSDPGMTITKNGGTTGQYDLAYPASPGNVHILMEFFSPAGTIAQNYIKAISETAGTASVICSAPNGTAAYGASGDKIYVDIIIDAEKST